MTIGGATQLIPLSSGLPRRTSRPTVRLCEGGRRGNTYKLADTHHYTQKTTTTCPVQIAMTNCPPGLEHCVQVRVRGVPPIQMQRKLTSEVLSNRVMPTMSADEDRFRHLEHRSRRTRAEETVSEQREVYIDQVRLTVQLDAIDSEAD